MLSSAPANSAALLPSFHLGLTSAANHRQYRYKTHLNLWIGHAWNQLSMKYSRYSCRVLLKHTDADSRNSLEKQIIASEYPEDCMNESDLPPLMECPARPSCLAQTRRHHCRSGLLHPPEHKEGSSDAQPAHPSTALGPSTLSHRQRLTDHCKSGSPSSNPDPCWVGQLDTCPNNILTPHQTCPSRTASLH